MKILFKPHMGVICGQCLKIMVSWHRHDCKTCGCPNETMVDGGRDYLRWGAKDMDKAEIVSIAPADWNDK